MNDHDEFIDGVGTSHNYALVNVNLKAVSAFL